MKKLYAIIAVFFLVFTLSSQATVSAESLSPDHNDGHAEEQEVNSEEDSAAMEQENENDLGEEEQEEEQIHNNNAEESAADIREDENQEEQEDETEKQSEQPEADNANVENEAQSEEDEEVEETEQEAQEDSNEQNEESDQNNQDEEDEDEEDEREPIYPVEMRYNINLKIDKDLDSYEGVKTEIEIDENMKILEVLITSSEEYVDTHHPDTEPTDFEYEQSGHTVTVDLTSDQLLPYQGKYVVITVRTGFGAYDLIDNNENDYTIDWKEIEEDPNPDPAPEEDPEPSPSPEEPESDPEADAKPDNESKPEQETESTPEPEATPTPEPNPAPKSDEEADESVVEIGDNENNDNEENRLPDTATDIFNILGIAFALFVIGVLGLVFSRKRQTN